MPLEGEEIRISLKRQWWWPLAAGVLFGLALRTVYSGRPGGAYDAMMGSFAILAPTASQRGDVYVAELRARRTWSYYFWMGGLVNVLFVVGTFVIQIEG